MRLVRSSLHEWCKPNGTLDSDLVECLGAGWHLRPLVSDAEEHGGVLGLSERGRRFGGLRGISVCVASAGIRQGKRAYPLLVLTLLVWLLFVGTQSRTAAAASGYQTISLVGKKIVQGNTAYRPEAASPGDVAIATVTSVYTSVQPTAPPAGRCSIRPGSPTAAPTTG